MDFEIRGRRKAQGPRKLTAERHAFLQLVSKGVSGEAVVGSFGEPTPEVGLVVVSVEPSPLPLPPSPEGSHVVLGASSSSIIFWQMGSLSQATWPKILAVAPPTAIGLLVAPRYGRRLDLLAVGERPSRHLGVDVERLRLHLIAMHGPPNLEPGLSHLKPASGSRRAVPGASRRVQRKPHRPPACPAVRTRLPR